MIKAKVAILFLSHLTCETVLKEFDSISRSMKGLADVYLLAHVREKPGPHRKRNVVAFSNGDLEKLGYQSIANTIIPGSAHFPLMYFFLRYSYEYYWVIEYDVRFTGEWKIFFNSFHDNDADLLASYIREFVDDPAWGWWKALAHPSDSIPLEQRIRSFHPIYRTSNAALRHIHQCQRNQWIGHFEVLIPTLLRHGGFKIEDFGGNGKFTAVENRCKFYTNETLRWRPVFTEIGTEKETLYHPLKIKT